MQHREGLLEIVEFGPLTLRQLGQLAAGEVAPFGKANQELEFRPKNHHVGIVDETGTLIATGGWDIVSLEVEGYGAFDVFGSGALIVRRDCRRKGIGSLLIKRLTACAEEHELPALAFLCGDDLVDMYQRFGFRLVDAPVWVDQHAGPVLYPGRMMWGLLDPDFTWPAGAVRVLGLPF